MKSLLLALALAAMTPAVSAAPHHGQVQREDGSIIHYTLDQPADPVGLLLLSQGSGCKPGIESAGLATVRAAFPRHAALIVEKAGIAPTMDIDPDDCPPDYHARYTVTQRVEDYRTVLDALAPIQGPLILFGGSEGGLAVAMLATRVEPEATIIFSSATGMSFGDMVKSTVPAEGHPTIDAGFAAARANPDSSDLFAGHAYRFWADILDLRSIDYMRKIETPMLLIQGGLDVSGPVAAARATVDAFAAEGLCNLTYWEFPALDHGMLDPTGGNHLPAVAAMAARWVETPIPAC